MDFCFNKSVLKKVEMNAKKFFLKNFKCKECEKNFTEIKVLARNGKAKWKSQWKSKQYHNWCSLWKYSEPEPNPNDEVENTKGKTDIAKNVNNIRDRQRVVHPTWPNSPMYNLLSI